MTRITAKDLRALMARMARETGAPEGPAWVKREEGHTYRAVVGALVLQEGSATYGNAWAISRICNEAGGERQLIRGRTARELWDRTQAWLDGYEARYERRVRALEEQGLTRSDAQGVADAEVRT